MIFLSHSNYVLVSITIWNVHSRRLLADNGSAWYLNSI